eukprot:345220-Hanusia_phi.AAC.3
MLSDGAATESVQVDGSARRRAEAKDSWWAKERAPIEARKGADVTEVILPVRGGKREEERGERERREERGEGAERERRESGVDFERGG